MEDAMLTNTPRSTYAKPIISKKIPYWLQWPLIGLITFITHQILVYYFNERDYFLTSAFLSIFICLLPIIYAVGPVAFFDSVKPLIPIIDEKLGFDRWLHTRIERIFTFKSTYSRILTITVVIAGAITVNITEPLYTSNATKIFDFSAFILLLFICGQGAYVALDLIVSIKEIVNMPLVMSFYAKQSSIIKHIQRYFYFLTIKVTLIYAMLAIAVWAGPYGLNRAMQAWLIVLSLYPIGMFLWFFFQIHVLMLNIKQSQIIMANKEVQKLWGQVVRGDKFDVADDLTKMMDIQDRVEKFKEWPIQLGSTITFLVTLAAAVTQTVIAVVQILKP
jgi:hypothetical protein